MKSVTINTHEQTERKRAEERLERINACLLNLGPDFDANVERLTALCGELLGAVCALYNRLEGGMLCSVGRWHAPPGYEPNDQPDGHICYDVIRQGGDDAVIVRNLPETSYAATDPNVAKYGLKTYSGHVVRCAGEPVGSLCVVFQENVEPTNDDNRVLGIIASSLGREEERKRAEERIRRLNRVYAMLCNINQAIVRIREPRALYEKACRIAVEDGGFRMAWIGLADAANGKVLPAAHAGVTDGYLEKLDIVLGDDPRGRGPTGSAVRAGEHMVCNDIQNDPRMAPWREDALRNGYHSSATFPLKVLGEVRGAFGLYAAESGFFDDDEIKLLDELAMDIGFAMEFAEREVERKRAEEALRDSETRYRALFENSADGILIADLETKIFKYANPAVCRMLGYTGDELRTLGVSEIHPKDALPHVAAEFEAQARGEKSLAADLPCVRKDGTIFCADVNATTVTIDSRQCLVGFFHDTTERKKVEEALRDSETRYHVLFETCADGILIADLETKTFKYANPAVCRMLGYTEEELRTLGVSDIHPKDALPHVAAEFEAQARGEKTLAADLPCLRKDGTILYADVNATTITIDRRQCLVGFFRDTTERRQTQKALELSHDALSRRNDELQDFYHIVTHELKTPLTSAREFASILLDGIAGPLTDDQKQYLQLIRESCDQLQFCVSDLLEATRLDTGKLEVHSVDTSMETLVANVVGAMTPAMQAKGVDLRREIDPALANVPLDERRINQVCMNLLGNALKFTPAGGVVTVRVGNDPDNPEWIRFSVSDTGRGIAPEHLDRIFDKLYQVRETDTSIVGGLGLGLYIASGIVRLHGGRMWAESTLGRGSTLHFTVPKRALVPRRHILFVDDDLVAQKMVGDVLEHAGFMISVAGDGETALKMVQGQAVDLAIVDLYLPGMPGPVLMRELRNKWSDLPLLLYTGHPDSQLMTQALEVTPVTLLTKTCSKEKLIATVRALLEAKGSRIAECGLRNREDKEEKNSNSRLRQEASARQVAEVRPEAGSEGGR